MAFSRGLAVGLAFSLAPRILPGPALGAESEDGDSGNGLPPTPPQFLFPGERALLPPGAPVPTHKLLASGWSLFISQETPQPLLLLYLSLSEETEGGRLHSPGSLLALLCASAHRAALFLKYSFFSPFFYD